MEHPLKSFEFCPICGSAGFAKKGFNSARCAACGFEYFGNASAAVAAVITNNRGEILLTTRACEPAKGTLDLPGGFVMPGETAEEALKREVREELGVEIELDAILFTVPNEYPYSGIVVNTLDLFCEVHLIGDKPFEPADDVSSAAFYSIKSLDLNRIGLKSIRCGVKKYIETHSH